MTARTGAQRKVDVLAKLAARHADVWVASASETGRAHLVPLSLAWDGERVIIATEPSAVTTRNIVSSGIARLALGATRDVVMVDAVLDRAVDVGRVPPEVADAYAGQADWDPRAAGGDFWFLLLRPERIQAWREADEIAGRTVMREGVWLF
ncbi:MAG TPA: pyridoxamine 5'-phosphate oxidase family protein [Acidimicrobiia bacterium]|nr:pyridoxamine 5'-phosphate oxidase family protein [Acidimicrobiia bacterium]